MLKWILISFVVLLSSLGFGQHQLTFQVDLNAFSDFDPAIHQVYVSGAKHNSPGGIGNLPVWPIPGSNAAFLMNPVSGLGNVFTVTINNVESGAYAYKYFLVANNQASWNLGEWGGTNNRVVVVGNDNLSTNDIWGLMNPNQEVQLVINEIMASNGSSTWDEDGDEEDWIEIYNAGNTAVHLLGFGLSDEENNPLRWTFPSIFILPNQYLVVWASGKNRSLHNQPLHTNFSISISGEPILLSDADGNILNIIPAVPHQTDIAYGRFPNASVNLTYLTNPTPNDENNGPGYSALSSPLLFSMPEGYYANAVSVSISSPDNNTVIRYTLDGSEPNANSAVYSAPLLFDQLNDVPNFFSMIPTNNTNPGPPYFEGWEPPLGNVYKINVLRAKAFNSNTPEAPSFNATYIIDPLVHNRYSLPVMSLSSDFQHLFDNQTGVYVYGNSENYWQDWERPGNFTYFTKNGTLGFNENAGYQVHGNFSRSRPRKSLRMIFRNTYGNSWLDYPIFENKATDRYKRLILRNGGNDWGLSLIRDGIPQILAKDFKVETQYFQPTILFINGEYWGIHNLRDRYDVHYFETKYGLFSNELTIMENNSYYKDGNPNGVQHYLDLIDFIQNNNLSAEANYTNVKEKVDIESFIDFQLAQIYPKNTDWPGNNVRYWRYFITTSDTQTGVRDGRWRWMLFDMDFAFDLGLDYVPHVNSGPAHNTLAFALASNGPAWPNPSWSTLMLRKLTENDSFKIQFTNRYCDLLNTVYHPDFVTHTLDSIQNILQPEMQEHINRWRNPVSLESWVDELDAMKDFAQQRADFQFQHLQSAFDWGEKHKLTVEIDNPLAGFVRLNSIELIAQTNGISEPVYPWQGDYLNGSPITLSALAKQGYVFSHWSGAISSTEPSITLNLSDATQVKAHFQALDDLDFDLLHFWFFGTALPNDTPLQEVAPTFNTGNAILSYQSCLQDYPYAVGHPNWRKASLERRNSPTNINYIPEGNSDLTYAASNMRALQVRQPFQFENRENALFLQFSTSGYEQILLRLAAIDEGAVDGLVIDYKNPVLSDEFSTLGISSVHSLSDSYNEIEINMNQVVAANDADTLIIRIRFLGANMTADQGNRVTFNNISVSGIKIEETIEEEPEPEEVVFGIFPNPAKNELTISTNSPLTHLECYDVSGKFAMRFNTTGNETLDISKLSAGLYFFKAFLLNGELETRKISILK